MVQVSHIYYPYFQSFCLVLDGAGWVVLTISIIVLVITGWPSQRSLKSNNLKLKAFVALLSTQTVATLLYLNSYSHIWLNVWLFLWLIWNKIFLRYWILKYYILFFYDLLRQIKVNVSHEDILLVPRRWGFQGMTLNRVS